jgi:hypothetical protein
MTILNARHLRDYPRLMLVTTWLILGANLIFHQGWISALGQVIAGDFIMFYSTGQIYRLNPSLIYDFETQTGMQQAITAPTVMPGYNPYMNPPFVAPFYSLFTFVSLHEALFLWTLLAILSVFLSVYFLYRLIPANRKAPELSYPQLVILVLSFFPFIEGMQSGQNHWLTLLLMTGIIMCMFKEKWYLAGVLAGFLIYKPQFALGFVIIWLVWRNLKALTAFAVVVVIWIGGFVLANGINLIHVYLQMSQVFMSLPYVPGFPNYLLVTFYGLLTSFFPQNTQAVLSFLSNLLLLVSAIGLAGLAYRQRNFNLSERIPTIVAALIFPLLATPYALLHDLVILIPAYVLWSIYSNTQKFTIISAVIYLGAFFLTLFSALTRIAWNALLVLGLFVILVAWIYRNRIMVLGIGGHT